MACDELIDVAGRAAIQAVWVVGAAGGRATQQGKQRTGRWSGMASNPDGDAQRPQVGRESPRLRQKGRERARKWSAGLCGHAGSAAAERAHVGHPDARCFDAPIRSVIPEMADTVGVSKSSVSRQIIEASEAEVETCWGGASTS